METFARFLARCYLWATHRLYDELAWAYDLAAWLVSAGQWGRWRRTVLAHVAGGRVLEIGFGTGELLIEMARRGWQVCGLDLSPAMQRVTAGKMRRRGVWAPRLRGRAQALPFADGSLETIVATFPAEYIASPATWREAARTLRPGGRLVIGALFVEPGGAPLGLVARLVHTDPREGTLARVQRLADAHGFRMTVAWHEVGRARVPVIILEK